MVEEIQLIESKTINATSFIKFYHKKNPDRYKDSYNLSISITDSIKTLADLLNETNRDEIIKEKVKNLNQFLGRKNNKIRGSSIYDIINSRLSNWIKTKRIDRQKMYWDIINLELELQTYLHTHINDDLFFLGNINPLIIDDSLIYATAADSLTIVSIKVWDISQPDTLFYSDKNKNLITDIELKNGVGILKEKQLDKFPNGYKGVMRVRTQRGDTYYYPFENE